MRHYIVSSNALIMDLNQIVAEHQPIVQAIIVGDADEGRAPGARSTTRRRSSAPRSAMARQRLDEAAAPAPAKPKTETSRRRVSARPRQESD